MKPCILRLLSAALIVTPVAVRGQGAVGLDTNHNGLSDLFETLYPLASQPGADTDGDGATNLEECLAGTNPLDPTSRADFSGVTAAANSLTAKWQSVKGKRYQVQMSADLGAASWTNEGSTRVGNGGELTEVCPVDGERMFVRLVSDDIDSDSDGLSDWEEDQVHTDPTLVDSNGDGLFGDLATVLQALSSGNTILVSATDSSATEGPTANNPGRFTLTRCGNLNPLTVTFALSGTATAGSDYTASPATSVFFPLGATTAVVDIAPLDDATPEAPETVILTVQPGTGYTVGALNSATLSLDDASLPAGTGLTGAYYDNASDTYSNSANFNPVDLKAVRLDPTIDFLWDATSGRPDRPHPALVDADYHSVRWTGQIMPQYTEAYTLFTQANKGSKLWIDGVLIADLDLWGTASSTERSTILNLVAGRKYNVQIDYYDLTGTSHMYLRWQSASQAKQVVPSNRLFPAASGANPVMTGAPWAVGIVGGPFSYQIAAGNAPTSFLADGLPAGLTLNPATGLISGVPTGAAGLYFACVGASNGAGSTLSPLTIVLVSTGGLLTRDVWDAPLGTDLAGIPLQTAPSSSTTLADFTAPVNSGDNFGERIRGYLTAPATGNYEFFLTTGDENAELWVSATGDPGRRLKRSWVVNAAPAGSFETVASQKSFPMRMVAGQRYYIETLRREISGDDRLTVGWRKPSDGDGVTPVETIPAYAISPYEPPVGGSGQKTLYITNLTPQNNANTLGNGSALLEVSDDETEATLTYNFANLTGPMTQHHLHSGAHGGAIVFDLDVVPDLDGDPNDNHGVYHWVIAPTGNITVPSLIQALHSGQIYLNLHTELYPAGEIKGFLQLAQGSRDFVPPASPPAWTDDHTVDTAVVRFLNQATFGASEAAIAEVKALGYEAWIDKQQNPALTPITLNQPQLTQFYLDYPRDTANGDGAQSNNDVRRFWWKSAITGPDQLRQRVGFALSEIMVVSDAAELDSWSSVMLDYYDILCSEAFGNFRTLLERVTVHAGMGLYLDMYNNVKPNPTTGSTPNENYAREIMQLFSVGLRRLHPDGSLVLGVDGFPVPTYSQDEVVALANCFTGWVRGPVPTDPLDAQDAYARYLVPMATNQANHSTFEKVLLDNTVMPDAAVMPDYNGDGSKNLNDDLKVTHDMLFHHPNTGPFICRQLIQRLVTDNPSPGYIYRATKVFNDDGTGVRGNLGAVVKTILLDYEARDNSPTGPAAKPGFGHLREPVLRQTAMLRALHGYSGSEGKPLAHTVFNTAYNAAAPDAGVPRYFAKANPVPSPGWNIGTFGNIGQTPLRASTVFNFFEPDYQYVGTAAVPGSGQFGLYAPAFQITSETTVVNLANFFYNLPRSGWGAASNWENPADPPITLNGCVWTNVNNPATTGSASDERFFVTVPNAAGLRPNMFVSGDPAFPANSWIESITGNTLRITRAPTAPSPVGGGTLNFTTSLFFPADSVITNTGGTVTSTPFNGSQYSVVYVNPPGGDTGSTADDIIVPDKPLTTFTWTQNYLNGNTPATRSVAWNSTDGNDVRLDLTTELALAYDPAKPTDPEALVDHFNRLLCAGTMVKSKDAGTPNSYYYLWNYLRTIVVTGSVTEATVRTNRVNDIIAMIVLAPEFNVQR